jgi:hypothetical protein
LPDTDILVSVSVNAAFDKLPPTKLFGLVSVKVSVLTPPTGMVAGAKDLAMVGGE